MRRTLEPLAALALAALAVALVFESGSRGFFPLDQSNVFEGGYRLLRGQVPYRDFVMPVGPLTFVVQVPFFLLFGVNNRAQLLHAGAINAAAALLAVSCVKRLFPGALVPAYLAGLATAAWFYPIFGTPAFDQMALFFHLAALVLLLPALADGPHTPQGGHRAALASGFVSGLAFFSKQNAGALSVVCLLFVIAAAAGARRTGLALRFVAGLACCAALFLFWLVLFSDPGAFVRHFLLMPIAEGLRRATSGEFHAGVLADLRSSGLTLGLVLSGPLLSLAFLSFHAAGRLGGRRGLPARAVLGFVVSLSLALLQWGFIRVTSNLPDNAFGFAGLAAALALLAALEALSTGGSAAGGWRRHVLAAAVVGLVALPLARAGRDLARSRQVHEYWFEIHYRNAPVSRALAPARWSARRDDPRAIRVEDVDALLDFLRERRAPFFVFPDLVALYGLAGVEPPQPLVWFHRGLTYPAEYDVELDRRVVRELRRHGVRYVVIERVSFLGTEKRLSHFPLLGQYLAGFREVARFGIFGVREKPN